LAVIPHIPEQTLIRMKPENVLDKLGHSINNPEIEAILSFFEIKERPSAVLQSWGGLSITGVKNQEIGIYFDFTTEMGYNSRYGEVKSKFTTEKYELILEEITFGDKSQYPYQLPFGLTFNDEYKTIYKKIGGSLTSKSAPADNEGDIVYRFLTTDYRIIVRQKDGKAIQFVRIFPIEVTERKNIELKKSLKKQNTNISDWNKEQLLSLKEQLPTLDWTKSMLEGDSCFTEKNIYDSEVLFNSFLDQLILGATKKDANKIYSGLTTATMAFNKLQKKHNGFIETFEREQIIDFFEKAIKMTGFQIEEGLDMTQDIREW
jgi:hypothetical protein